MNYLEKLNSDINIMNLRINDYIKLRNEYYEYVMSLKYKDEYSNPVEAPKTIWLCWFQRLETAPELVQSCIRKVSSSYPEYKKILIDEFNLFKYVNIDESVIKKWKAGVISNTAFSNIVRLEVLIKYGGIWMDATVLCTGLSLPSYMTDSSLFVYSSWKWISGDVRPVSTWLIAANKEHPILMAVRDCLVKYWNDKDELVTYFVFHMFFAMVIEKFPKLFEKIPKISNVPPHFMQFEMHNEYNCTRFEQLTEMSPIHKLTYKLGEKILINNNNLYKYVADNY